MKKMKKMKKSSNKKMGLMQHDYFIMARNGLVVWLVPFIVSMFLVRIDDAGEKIYLPNYLVFKILMIVIAGLVTYYFYQNMKKQKLLQWATAHVFLLVNGLMDLLILVVAFQMPLIEWVMTILPLYLLGFYGLVWLLNRRV